MSKPNWSEGTNIHGGEVNDIPEPHVRKFPHKGLKRRVEVRITTYVGVCFGARHYTAVIEEEDNPIWNSAKNAWQSAYNDREKNGSELRSPNFTSEKAARDWVQWMLRGFDPKMHTFHYKHQEKPPRWFYAHEGD